jgi:cytochrome c-type biogenesis protein CcmI
MLLFLAIVVLLLVIVLTFIVRPLFWPNTIVKMDVGAEKREIFRQQFDEIEQDKINGMLDATQYNIAKSELERRMLDEVGVTGTVTTNAKPDRLLAIILIVLLPILSIYLYLVIGRPMAIIYATAAPIASSETNATSMEVTADANISGTVSISPALAKKLDPSATVFIFARATKGPPMPLAIVRTVAKELPYSYHLDDSNALMSDLKLSQASEVVIVVRVSKSGDAKLQAGDFQGLSAPVTPNGGIVDIEIDKVVP